MTTLTQPDRRTFRALEVRDCRLFLEGQLVSQLGSWVQVIGQTLLVLDLTGSGLALGIVTAAQTAPTLVLGAWGGLVCDRFDKRQILLVTQSVMLLQAAMLGAFALFDAASVGLVFALAGLYGIVKAFDDPPRRALITELVDPALVANAVGLNSAVLSATRIAGPAFAAIVTATVGVAWCFFLNAASFVYGLWTIVRVEHRSQRPTGRLARASGQIREGLRYAWARAELRLPLALLVVVASTGFNWQVVLPLLATQDLGGGDGTIALLTSALGAGALIGSLLVARRSSVDAEFLARSTMLLGVSGLAVAASPNTAIAAASTMCWGITAFVLLAGGQSALQLGAIWSMRGRVMALYGIVVVGGAAISGFLAGWAAEHVSVRVSFLVAGGVAMVAGATAHGRRATIAAAGLP